MELQDIVTSDLVKEFKCASCLCQNAHTKLLNCFHVICEKCLAADEQDITPFLTCPICSVITSVPTGGVHDLQTLSSFRCLEHRSRNFKLFCRTCEKYVCHQCKFEEHQDHDCDLLENMYPACRDKLKAVLMRVSDQLLSVQKKMTQLDSLNTELSDKKISLEACLVNVVKLIHEALDERKDRLLDQLHETVKVKLEHLFVCKNHLGIIEAQLNNCLVFIEEILKNGANEEMLVAKYVHNQVEALLGECDSSLNLNDDFSIELSASPEALIDDCLGFGKIVTSACDKSLAMDTVSSLSKMLLQRLGTPIMTISEVKGPCGVAISQNGEIVIAEGRADCISVFNLSGDKLRSFGRCGTGEGEFSFPCELAIDSENNIFVVDGCNKRVQKFTSDGQFLSSVGTEGTGILQFCEPDGISVNPINEKIYVVDNNMHRIQVLNPDLTFFSMFGKEGDGKGYMHYPWGIACSRNGEVYITDSGNCCVQVFTSEGQFLREFSEKGDGGGNLKWPTGIAVSDTGLVYVTEYGNHSVSIFTSDGEFLKSFGRKGKNNGEFGNLRGIMVDQDGVVYVCDPDNNRVVLF